LRAICVQRNTVTTRVQKLEIDTVMNSHYRGVRTYSTQNAYPEIFIVTVQTLEFIRGTIVIVYQYLKFYTPKRLFIFMFLGAE
jgi:hypothetical protein